MGGLQLHRRDDRVHSEIQLGLLALGWSVQSYVGGLRLLVVLLEQASIQVCAATYNGHGTLCLEAV